MRTFEIVPDSERGDSRGAHRSPAFEALLAGRTIRVPLNAGVGNWSRQAKRHGMRQRTHRTPAGLVVWFEPRAGDRDAARIARLWNVAEDEVQDIAAGRA